MKRIMALAALTSVVALFAFTTQAAAQDVVQGTLTADPATVPAEGEYTFTVSGSGFIANTSVSLLPCTLPGDPLSPASSPEAIGAAFSALAPISGDCDLGKVLPTPIDADGSFSVQHTATVGQNFAWVAGDNPTTQSGVVPVFIVDPSMMEEMDEMVPEGGADTGFGGMAGSDGNSVAVPLAAGIAAVVALGGATLVRRRNA